MIDLAYSLVIEATQEPDFFGFYSPDLEGFTGVRHSVEDCLYKAKWGMKEHVELLDLDNHHPERQENGGRLNLRRLLRELRPQCRFVGEAGDREGELAGGTGRQGDLYAAVVDLHGGAVVDLHALPLMLPVPPRSDDH